MTIAKLSSVGLRLALILKPTHPSNPGEGIFEPLLVYLESLNKIGQLTN